MTRRQFLLAAGPAATATTGADAMVVPVRLILDSQVKWKPYEAEWFRSRLWAEAVRDLTACGIRLQTTEAAGEVSRPPFREPVITGLERGTLNVVVTTRIPMTWDGGRALCGVTTRYRGFHLCMVALLRAHGHQVPFFSVNTCLHELLHVLMLDIFEPRPQGASGQAREWRVDLQATRMWLFGDGRAVRESTRTYLERLRSESLA